MLVGVDLADLEGGGSQAPQVGQEGRDPRFHGGGGKLACRELSNVELNIVLAADSDVDM